MSRPTFMAITLVAGVAGLATGCDDSARVPIPGALKWVQNLRNTDASRVEINVDGGGNVYLGALNRGTATFERSPGSEPDVGTGCMDTYLVIARYIQEQDDKPPVFNWSRYFCGAFREDRLALALSPNGRTTTAFEFEGTIEFEEGVPITGGTPGSPAGAVVSFDESRGLYQWGIPLLGTAVALEPRQDDSIAVFANRGPDPSSETPQIVITLLSENGGGEMWSQGFGEPAQEVRGSTMAVDNAGNVVIAGRFSGSTLIGSPLDASPDASARFVAKLRGSDGVALWGQRFAEGDGTALHLTTTSAGDVVVAGVFVDDTTGSPTNQVSVVILDADNGTATWERQVGDASGASLITVSGVVNDGVDNLVATGTFLGQFTIGTRELASPDAAAMYITKLEPELGDPLWSFPTEGTGTVRTSGVVADNGGNVLSAGTFEERVPQPGDPEQAKEIYFLKLSP